MTTATALDLETWVRSGPPLTEADREARRLSIRAPFAVGMGRIDANFNGHHIHCDWRRHSVRGAAWVAEYWYGGRQVVGRGSLASAVEGALRVLNNGQRGHTLGVSVAVDAREPVEEQRELLRKLGFEVQS